MSQDLTLGCLLSPPMRETEEQNVYPYLPTRISGALRTESGGTVVRPSHTVLPKVSGSYFVTTYKTPPKRPFLSTQQSAGGTQAMHSGFSPAPRAAQCEAVPWHPGITF